MTRTSPDSGSVDVNAPSAAVTTRCSAEAERTITTAPRTLWPETSRTVPTIVGAEETWSATIAASTVIVIVVTCCFR